MPIPGGGPAGSEPPKEKGESPQKGCSRAKSRGSDFLASDVRQSHQQHEACGSPATRQVTRGSSPLENLDARGELERGSFASPTLTARLRGHAGALGKLGRPSSPLPSWNVQAKLDGTISGQAPTVAGRVPWTVARRTLQLRGAGTDWRRSKRNGAGPSPFETRRARRMAEPFSDSFVSVRERCTSPGAQCVAQVDKPQLGHLHTSFTVQDGWMRLARPARCANARSASFM